MSNTRRRAVLGVPVVVAAVLTAVPAQATEPDPVVTVAGSTATYVDRGVDDPTRAVTGTLRTWIAEDDHDHDARSAGIELADGRLLPLEEGVAVPQRFEGGRVTAEVAGPTSDPAGAEVAQARVAAPAALTAAPTPTAHRVYVALASNLGAFDAGRSAIEAGVDTTLAEWQQDGAPAISSFTRARTGTFTSSVPCDRVSYEVATSEAAAAFPDVSFSNGNHLVVLVPCANVGGVGSVGRSIASGGRLLLRWGGGYEQAGLRHELGHNLSLLHANRRECSTRCSVVEYGNVFSFMGFSLDDMFDPTALDTVYRDQLGVLAAGEVEDVKLPSGSDVATTTYALRGRGASTGLRGLRITDPRTGRVSWVDVRDGAGRDAGAFYGSDYTLDGSRWSPGVVVTQRGSDGSTQLVTDPDGSGGYAVSRTRGQSWTADGVALTVGSSASGTTQVTVTLSRENTTGDSVDPVPTAEPVALSGAARVGSTLTAVHDGWSTPPTTWSYRWTIDGATVPGATTRTFRLPVGALGRDVAVEVVGDAGRTTERSATSAPVTVGRGLLRAVRPAVVGTMRAGSTARVGLGTWPTPATSRAYRWYLNGKAIPGATSSRLRLKSSWRGKKVTVKVTGRRTGYTTLTVGSSARTVRR
ncbi:MAG: hypothetical protein PGN07_10985 [Aeromicrobium erythreum]